MAVHFIKTDYLLQLEDAARNCRYGDTYRVDIPYVGAVTCRWIERGEGHGSYRYHFKRWDATPQCEFRAIAAEQADQAFDGRAAY